MCVYNHSFSSSIIKTISLIIKSKMESKLSQSKSLSDDYDEEDYDIESQRSQKEEP